jgi:hypothetical protein
VSENEIPRKSNLERLPTGGQCEVSMGHKLKRNKRKGYLALVCLLTLNSGCLILGYTGYTGQETKKLKTCLPLYQKREVPGNCHVPLFVKTLLIVFNLIKSGLVIRLPNQETFRSWIHLVPESSTTGMLHKIMILDIKVLLPCLRYCQIGVIQSGVIYRTSKQDCRTSGKILPLSFFHSP